MNKILKIGIIGCGDFLRTIQNEFLHSAGTKVVALYDPVRERAEYFARLLGGACVNSVDDIIDSSEIDIVCIFVPPWLRKDLFARAAATGKHILATKPLANTIEAAGEIARAAAASRGRSAIIYNRTGDSMIECMREIFESGQIGRLALYRQDWLHHYPQWNKWALDRGRNGGPFIDAMIHNLNTVRYLMGRPAIKGTFFSDQLAHPGILSADTESLKLDFDGGVAFLFITWAADMAFYAADANDREHIDLFYMITDKGWRVVIGDHNKRPVIEAHRGFETLRWLPTPMRRTAVDRFADAILANSDLPRDLVSVAMASEDILMLRSMELKVSQTMPVSM